MSDSEGPGHVVGGRYRLLEPIGRGGMGTVWRAHDEVLGRDIAIKEITPPPEMAGPEREIFNIRTFREARAAGRVSHPGVAAVYDVLEERGHPWIAMQLVPSRSLGAALREDGPLSPAEAAGIGVQILAALQAAHLAGVLHRDIKPDNVLLTDDGRAVLTDFGIATLEDDASVTRTGTLIGTPAFIAPERAAGGDAVRASDLWSLGVTLYLAVEGRSPFQRGHALATLAAVIHDAPAPLSRAGALTPIIMGLLCKDPAERLTAEETAAGLNALVMGLSPQNTTPISLAAGRSPPDPPPTPFPPQPVSPEGGRRPAAAPPVAPEVRTTENGGMAKLGALAGLTALTLTVGMVSGGMAWLSARPPAGPAGPAIVQTSATGTPSPGMSADAPAPPPDQHVRHSPPETGPTQPSPTPSATSDGPADRDEPRNEPTRTPKDEEDKPKKPTAKPTEKPTQDQQSPPPEDDEEEPSDDEDAPGEISPGPAVDGA
ncbi:serine/threonine protein kinase [Streptosporangium sp. KLBMP 9127]